MNFNFTSQICTTKEQSERLLSLGLKKETADMSVSTDLGFPLTTPYKEVDKFYLTKVIPAWSLHRLIEIAELPQYWECISGNWYEEVIAHIQSMIHINGFNKEYLEE
jgi:hypothetical protein